MSSSDSETSKNLPNYDQSVCQSLIDHLKKQKAKNSASFHKLLYELFDEKLQDSIFICWLARKLSIEVIQLLRSQKMTKIWTPPVPPCSHLFDFGNPPPVKVQNVRSTRLYHHHYPK